MQLFLHFATFCNKYSQTGKSIRTYPNPPAIALVLIFRYDSTPHFPNLPNFPHHKHLPDDIIASEKPEITQVLKEATKSI